jgi:hypothetical protein
MVVMTVEKITIKSLLSMSDFPSDTMIRFLDDDKSKIVSFPLNVQVKTHRIFVPPDQAEDILDISSPIPTSILREQWRVKLKAPVKEWCMENLKGNVAYPRRHAEYYHATQEEMVRYTVEFATSNDALYFKLRWIG